MAPPETQAFYTGNIILQYFGTSNLIFSFIHETFGMATQDQNQYGGLLIFC